MDNFYATIFGESPATMKARENRDSAFQQMLNTRKQAVEKQRTDDVKMARWNAMGNLLTTLVQPLGWAIGGKGNTMNTGGTQKYDERQYLNAFNRAVKASDDLRNIGTAEDEYRFKLADEEYKRQAANDQRMQNAYLAELQDERRAQQKIEYEKQRQQDELEKIAARSETQKWLAEYRATHRVTSRGGLSVDDRALIAARNQYETYRRTCAQQGIKPMPFEQYMKNEGYEVQDTTQAAPAPKPAGSTGANNNRNTTTTNSNTTKNGAPKSKFNVNGTHGSTASGGSATKDKSQVKLQR